MAYFEFHDTLPDHPKTKHLARLMGVPKVQAIGHLACLFAWTIRYCPTGKIPVTCAREALEIPVQSRVDPVEILLLSGFATLDGDWLSLDSWDKYTRNYLKARADRERKREERASRPRTFHGLSKERRGEQNRTEQNGARGADAAAPVSPSAGGEEFLTGGEELAERLLEAYAFCKTPGPATKLKEFEDLVRQGVSWDHILSLPDRVARLKTYDFYQIIDMMRPKARGVPYVPAPEKPRCQHPNAEVVREREGERLLACACGKRFWKSVTA